jgi:DNA-binding NarL/FixJ family response regulator
MSVNTQKQKSQAKLIIIDDHSLFRESARRLVEGFGGFEVVGTAGDAQTGEKLAVETQPDAAIIDLSLPDKSGIQLTRSLKTMRPELKIIIVSMHSKIDYIVNALQAGAQGYVVKDTVAQALHACLEAVLNNEYYLDAALSQEIAPKLMDISNKEECTDSAYGSLSPREQEVMRLLAQGESTRDIADKLFISAKTVANHRANIMAKLDLHSTIELFRYAAQLGLIGDT